MVGSPPPNVVLPTRRNTPVSLRRVGAGTLFLGSNAQRFHLAVKVTTLKAQQLRGSAYVAFGLFQLLENVIMLGRLAHILPSYMWPIDTLFVLHRGGAFVAPKVRVFLEHIRAALPMSGAQARAPSRTRS